MDLNSLLNNDAPTRPSSVSHTSSHGPTPYIPSPSHRPSPFHTSPSSAQGFSFPPPSPRPEQLPHQGYAQSPIGTPHPLSAQSTVPGSTPASASPLGSFSQTHQYSPLPQQHPTHALPAQTSPSPIASYIPHHHHGYPRQSPIASPVGGRGTHVQPVSGRATPAIAAPLPRDREKEREREGGRERERSASYRRERERDISVSPKTKVPFIAGEVVSPSFEGLPSREKPSYGSETPTGTPSGTLSRSASHHQSRPASQHLSAADVVFTRRSSMVPAGRGMDIMEVDGEGTPDRKWSSPVAERAGNPNGTGAQGHPPAPYANSLGPPNNSHHALAPAPPPSPAASLSNLPSEQPAMPVQHTPLPAQHLQRSTPTPTGFAAKPSPTAASAPIPAPPSPKRQPLLQSLGPPPTPTQSSGTADVANGSPNSSGPPRKRPRREEAPIWARKASRSSSSSPVLSGRRQPGMASAMAVNHPPPLPQHIVQNTTGQHQPRPPPPPTTSHHILSEYGPWEPTIINQQPIPELTREVANFLYRNVVMQTDPQLTANGGAMLEIEAKIGHLIDKNTNDRLRLPVLTETVMNDNDPSWRTQFRSSMTEIQHRTINNYLNQAFSASNPRPNHDESYVPRVAMEYVHTHERDSFYELPSDKYNTLPTAIRNTLIPRNKPRVRVTTDIKNGRVLKTIFKSRIADLNVYCPGSPFDWRISVNMEMPFECDVEKMYPLGTGGSPGEGDRNKDRMSYRHLAYQIDLTQVQTEGKMTKKEHELEVEVDAREIRKHGHLAKEGRPNAYETLVQGLVDNVKILIRSVE